MKSLLSPKCACILSQSFIFRCWAAATAKGTSALWRSECERQRKYVAGREKAVRRLPKARPPLVMRWTFQLGLGSRRPGRKKVGERDHRTPAFSLSPHSPYIKDG